jgi:hypothetical protein
MDKKQTPLPPSEPVPPIGTPAPVKDHWSVEVVGGFTLASTIVSAMSLFYVFMTFAIFA